MAAGFRGASLAMSDEHECRLTGRRCYLTHYGENRCSADPTPDDAVQCIRRLDDKRANMEKELSDMDVWIEAIKNHAAASDKPPSTKH